MHPDGSTPTPPPVWTKLHLWLAAVLGHRYAAFVQIVDRAVAAFALAFATKALGSGLFSIDGIVRVSYWQTAAAAGLGAVLAVVQGLLSTWVTGTPQLGAVVSRTLRYRRDLGYRPAHKVPLRPQPRVRAGRP